MVSAKFRWQHVPGDIVRLSSGDMIPADLRLLSAKDLFINQSALTGEAMPSEKSTLAYAGDIADPFDLPNFCFMGGSVVSGFGTGVIVQRQNLFWPACRQNSRSARADELRQRGQPLHLADDPLHSRDGSSRALDQWLDQRRLAGGAFIRRGCRGRIDAGDAADDRHRESRQGRDRHVKKARDREAPPRDPEFRRDGCLVHR